MSRCGNGRISGANLESQRVSQTQDAAFDPLACSISVPTASIILIQPFARRKASFRSSDCGFQPSKFENGCSITILSHNSLHILFTSSPALHKTSKSCGPTSLPKFLDAKESRSGKPSSMP